MSTRPRFSIFDQRTTEQGLELYMVGLSGSDFHLIDAMKQATDLYVIFTENWSERMFSPRTDDYATKYSLKGSAQAINWLMDCAGY